MFNGPDFIFKDIKNNLKIGLEIVSWKWNINNTIKNKDQVIKFAKTNIYNDKNEDEQLQQLKEIILNKSKKSNNYVKCDELYLGIVVSDTITDYKYYLFEILLNKFVKENNLPFKEIFIF